MPRRQPRKPSIGIELVQFVDAVDDFLDRNVQLPREIHLRFLGVRQEFVQRRIEETDRGRKTFQRLEDAEEVLALIRQQLRQRVFAGMASVSARIISRIASMRLPSKNMCSVRVRPMPTAPNATALRGLLRRVGVRADWQARELRAPFHELDVVLELLGGLRGLVAVQQTGDDFGRRGFDFARIDGAGGAVNGEEIAFLERLAARW